MGNNLSQLHQAARDGDTRGAQLAIQQRPSSVDDVEPQSGRTPLHFAAEGGHGVIVRELLARGAAPNLADRQGRTPLHLAAAGGHVEAMKALLRRGADPLRRDAEDRTPLDAALAAQQGAATALLADALAGRGLPSTPRAQQQPQQAQQPQAPLPAAPPLYQQQQQQQHAAGRVAMPDLATLAIGGGGGGGGVPAAPRAPLPAAMPSTADDDWLSQLPLPPGFGGGGAVAKEPPSAPPLPNAPPMPPPLMQAQPQAQPQAQQQQAPLPEYYSYIRQQPPPAAAPAAAAAAAGGFPGGGGGGLYPSVPAAAAPGPQPQPAFGAGGDGDGDDDDDDDGWGGGGAQAAPAAAAGGDAESDDGWGDGGGARPSAVAPPPPPPAAGPVSGGAGPAAAAASGRPSPSQQQGGGGVDLNAAVGAAAAGAGKVAGAVGGAAVHLLTGLLRPRGSGSGGGGGNNTNAATTTNTGSSGGTQYNGGSGGGAGGGGRVFSYEELAAATGGFAEARRIGRGGFGPVFQGVLDGAAVAVKLLDPSGAGQQQGPAEFAAEVDILSRLHHPHVVCLLGSCPERCALVYELLDGGSLAQRLSRPELPDLAWHDRLRIATEVASALAFLHGASPAPICHMDLKPGNVLLTRSGLVAKVGDVGLARLMPAAAAAQQRHAHQQQQQQQQLQHDAVSTIMDTRLVGTAQYQCPDYISTGRLSPKCDVYSLGVVLLQLLSGRGAGEAVGAVGAALSRAQGGDAASFAAAIDPRAGAWPIHEASAFGHLAMRCVAPTHAGRPDLRREVLPALLQLRERAALYAAPAGGAGDAAGGRQLLRAASLGGGAGVGAPPTLFVCPITQEVMEEPCVAADGHTYERAAISAWLERHATSPMTNLPLEHRGLTPNLGLRSAIREWRDREAAAAAGARGGRR